jgi:prepilin-type N-terminal cleavage/methylation domain-containing protein
MKSQKGFSLTELLVAIGIFTIATLIMVPAFSGQMPKYRLNGAARQVMVDLMWVRMLAVSEGHRHRVVFIDDYRYRIDERTGVGSWNKKEIKNLKDNFLDVIVQGPDITFWPRGNATLSANSPVKLKNSEGSKTVVVSLTGRVRIP